MDAASSHSAVAEVQGLYGAFVFSEKLLQRIWAHGDFDQSRLVTTDGRAVVIAERGQWNRLGGPDFLRAKIRIDATVRTGDVELHLYAGDWATHRHAQDPAYRQVVLHVVLFPPPPAHRTLGHDGTEIPVVHLLTHLRHDLEEYAAEEAVEHLSNHGDDRLREVLRQSEAVAVARQLREGALRRWRRKVHYARGRIERLGFTEACHQTALEVLGYRYNRVPMLNLAARLPLAAWRTLGASVIETMLITEHANWARGGVRPANHPRRRLQQYAAWVAARPDWPERLRALGRDWPQLDATAPTLRARKAGGLASLRRQIAAEICGGALAGSRLDTLVCDALLPLLTACDGRDLAGLWWHWWAGDLPGLVERVRPALGAMHAPFGQGVAQGLIEWGLALEALPANP